MTDLHWIAAGDYQLALDGTTITAKNAKGRVLKTAPKIGRASCRERV